MIYFGLLTGFAMVVALLANMTLLPLLIAYFKPLNKYKLEKSESLVCHRGTRTQSNLQANTTLTVSDYSIKRNVRDKIFNSFTVKHNSVFSVPLWQN